MKKLRDAMLEQDVPAEKLVANQGLSEDEVAALDAVSGGEFQYVEPHFCKFFYRCPV